MIILNVLYGNYRINNVNNKTANTFSNIITKHLKL